MKRLFLIGFLVLGLNRLFAVAPVTHTEAVEMWFLITDAIATMTVYDDSSSGWTSTHHITGSGVQSSSPRDTAYLRPGQKYLVQYEFEQGPTESWLNYRAPDGYILLIDGTPSDMTYLPSGQQEEQHEFTIQLVSWQDYAGKTFSEFSGIQVGQSISWQIEMGSRPNGRTAGEIRFNQFDLTGDPASRDRIFFTAPANYGEVSHMQDGPSDAFLRQVSTPSGVVDLIDDVSDGYRIKFYRPDQMEGSPGNPSFPKPNQLPWKTIRVESPGSNQLKITETEGSVSRVSHISLTSGAVWSKNYTLTVTEGDTSSTVRTSTYTSSAITGGRQMVAEIKNASNVVATKTKYVFSDYAWGEQLTELVKDPDSAALTTTYDYHTDSSKAGNYGRVKSITDPTGNWTASEYYDDWHKRGMLKYRYQPYNDLPSTPTLSPTQGLVTYYEYTSGWDDRYDRPTLQTTKINNVLVGKKEWTHGDAYPANEWPREYATIKTYTGTSTYETSYYKRIRGDGGVDANGRLLLQRGPNGSETSINMSSGDYNASTKTFTVSYGPYRRTLSVNGTNNTSGTTTVSSWNGQSFEATRVIANRSTLTATITDSAHQVLRTETRIYTGSDFDLVSWQEFTYDPQGRLTGTLNSHGSETDRIYSGGRLATAIAEDGSETTYTNYDALGRPTTITKKGVASRAATLTSGYNYLAQPDVVTTNTYDASGRITQQVISASGGSSQTTTTVYDKAGRPTSTTVPGSFTTTHAYTNGGRTVTTTLPGGGTRIADAYLDGKPKSLSGTAVVAANHSYSVAGNGQQSSASYTGGVTANTVTTTTDWLGRTIKTSRAGWNSSGTFESTWDYNSLGQLTKSTAPGVADTLYEYDSLGYMWRSGLDVDGGGLGNASMDRITETVSDFTKIGADWHARQQTYGYLADNLSTKTLLGESLAKLHNLGANRVSETLTKDIFGNQTLSYTEVDDVNRLVTTTTETPLTTDVHAVSVSYNGRAVESRDPTGITIRTEHDALGRPTKTIHPRTGTTETAYIANSSLVAWVKDTTGTTQATYGYDPAGNRAVTVDPYGNAIRQAFNHRGQVTHTWGESSYPTQNTYDSLGRRIYLTTYRDGANWDSTAWPAGSTGTGDTTVWAYDAATGLLNSKTDAASRTVSYTYTSAGQIDVRTWARGVTTDYTYDGTTGELTHADYSDTTTDITNVYNRRGLLDSVTDITGTRTFDYCDCGKVEEEHLGTFHDSRHLSYQLDTTTTGAKGRTTGYTLKNSAQTTTLHQLSYDFDASGRLDEIVTAGVMGVYTFDYGYLANSNLVTTLTGNQAVMSAPHTFTRTWEADRNVVSMAQTKSGSTVIAQYDYTYDAMNRRASAVQSGTAFADYLITTHRRYGYNARSELTSDIAYSGSDVTNAPYGDLSGRRFEFTYDNLGNRTTSNRTGVAALADQYTTNNLNQYTARENNTLAVAGTVANGTINVVATPTGGTPQLAGRAGGYWGAEVVPGNTGGTVQETVDVVAAEPGSGASAAVSTDSASTPVPPAAQAYTYDHDGNPLTDDLWSYTWDAENRLIAMETAAGAITGGVTKEKLEFAYDYLHRRVEKKVYSWSGSAWTLSKHYKFLYEGWNVIREDELVGSKVKTLAWGLDLVGSLSQSGGVGALLVIHDTATYEAYLPGYDSNGNVAVMIDVATGNLKATYEYSPFGQFLRKEGTYADANPVRFSTKYTDEETDLVYYGRRYYDPKDGRFVGRDPIEEKGGINLYAFVANNSVNSWDYLGMNEDGVFARYLSPSAYEAYMRQLRNELRILRMSRELDSARSALVGGSRLASKQWAAEGDARRAQKRAAVALAAANKLINSSAEYIISHASSNSSSSNSQITSTVVVNNSSQGAVETSGAIASTGWGQLEVVDWNYNTSDLELESLSLASVNAGELMTHANSIWIDPTAGTTIPTVWNPVSWGSSEWSAASNGALSNMSIVASGSASVGGMGGGLSLQNDLSDGVLGGELALTASGNPTGVGIDASAYVGVVGSFGDSASNEGSINLGAGLGAYVELDVGFQYNSWGIPYPSSTSFTLGAGVGVAGGIDFSGGTDVLTIGVDPDGNVSFDPGP